MKGCREMKQQMKVDMGVKVFSLLFKMGDIKACFHVMGTSQQKGENRQWRKDGITGGAKVIEKASGNGSLGRKQS